MAYKSMKQRRRQQQTRKQKQQQQKQQQQKQKVMKMIQKLQKQKQQQQKQQQKQRQQLQQQQQRQRQQLQKQMAQKRSTLKRLRQKQQRKSQKGGDGTAFTTKIVPKGKCSEYELKKETTLVAVSEGTQAQPQTHHGNHANGRSQNVDARRDNGPLSREANAALTEDKKKEQLQKLLETLTDSQGEDENATQKLKENLFEFNDENNRNLSNEKIQGVQELKKILEQVNDESYKSLLTEINQELEKVTKVNGDE